MLLVGQHEYPFRFKVSDSEFQCEMSFGRELARSTASRLLQKKFLAEFT